MNQNPGNKPDKLAVNIKNADTVTIPAGAPVCMIVNGTDDGIAVVLPSNAAGKAFSFLYGVNLSALPVGQQGEAQVFGFVNNLILIRQTRAGTSGASSWAAGATVTDPLALVVDSVGNGFITSGTALAQTSILPFAYLAQTLASYAASATSTSDTRTSLTTLVKAFVRML
jgi:hypothetical protein